MLTIGLSQWGTLEKLWGGGGGGGGIPLLKLINNSLRKYKGN